MQIQISWLLQKPTDLDLHCLQRQSISGFSRTRVNVTLGELYLSPIQASVQLKPSFEYLDKVDTRQKAEQDSKLAEAGRKKYLQIVCIRKKN